MFAALRASRALLDRRSLASSGIVAANLGGGSRSAPTGTSRCAPQSASAIVQD